MGLVRLRQAIIVLFCGFHFLSVAWWAFPNSYTNFVLERPSNGSFAASIEKRFFQWHETNRQNPLFRLFGQYIDLVGAYQYWDFFAPGSPTTIHYLSVCQGIAWSPDRRQIDCSGEPLYKSFNGSLDDAMRSFNGGRSRSFRFAENFVHLDADAHDHFNVFWAQPIRKGHAAETLYLVDHQFNLKTNYQGVLVDAGRSDNFLSVLKFFEENSND